MTGWWGVVPNPTDKRLVWIARQYPPGVLRDTVQALASAAARHDLVMELKSSAWVDGALGPAQVFAAVAADRASAPDGPWRRGHTRFDRYLPWLASRIHKAQKADMKEVRDLARVVIDQRKRDGTYLQPPTAKGARGFPQRAAYAADRNLGVLAQKGVGYQQARALTIGRAHRWMEAANEEHYNRWPADLFQRSDQLRDQAEAEFGLVVDWAEAEGADLSQYSFTGAVAHAEDWVERREEELDCKELPASRRVYAWPDGWSVVELESTDELVCEGKALAHCAKEYTIDDLVAGGGDSRFYSLRDPSGKPIVTMMYDLTKGNVPGHALRGFANRKPTVPELARLYEFRSVHPDVASRWVAVDAPEPVKQSGSWEGRYQTLGLVGGRSIPFGEKVDVYSGGVYETEDVDQAVDWIVEHVGHSDYSHALDWFDSPDYEGPELSEEAREEAAQAEADRAREEALGDFDPSLRSDYGLEVDERTFRDQEEDAGDIAWVHYVFTGEQLGGWDEGDEMIDWMMEYSGDASFFGQPTPTIYHHGERGMVQVAYQWPRDADFGVVMHKLAPDNVPGGRPPRWEPRRLHMPGHWTFTHNEAMREAAEAGRRSRSSRMGS